MEKRVWMTSRSHRGINSQPHTPLQNKGERKKKVTVVHAWDILNSQSRSDGPNRNRVDITANPPGLLHGKMHGLYIRRRNRSQASQALLSGYACSACIN